ncbi:MAG: class I SAM-dependent methyltransferase [Gemmataceae bacterium]
MIRPTIIENRSLEAAVEKLYDRRFPAGIRQRRAAVWQVLCRDWLSHFIPPQARVLEVGGGFCEFINNIPAAERVVIDLNPKTRQFAAPGVVVHEAAAEDLEQVLPTDYFDIVFMSNFLEHCRTRDNVLQVLAGAEAVLKPGGKVLILGPNFRYCAKDYFDYFDHHLPLTEKAVVEALQLVGLTADVVLDRTLPFSFRGRLPSWPWLVRLYLHMPWVWKWFGAQFFVMGKKLP